MQGGAAVVQSQFVLWVVQLTLCLVLGYGVLWGFMPMGMSTCPKARVLIPSNIYLLVSRGAKATLCTVSPYIVCARDLKPGMSRWNTSRLSKHFGSRHA